MTSAIIVRGPSGLSNRPYPGQPNTERFIDTVGIDRRRIYYDGGKNGEMNAAIDLGGGNRHMSIVECGFNNYKGAPAVDIGDKGGALDSEGVLALNRFRDCKTAVSFGHNQCKGWRVYGNVFQDCDTGYLVKGHAPLLLGGSFNWNKPDAQAGVLVDAPAMNVVPVRVQGIDGEGLGAVAYFGRGNAGSARQPAVIRDCAFTMHPDESKHHPYHLTTFAGSTLISGLHMTSPSRFRIRRYDGGQFIIEASYFSSGFCVEGPGLVYVNDQRYMIQTAMDFV